MFTIQSKKLAPFTILLLVVVVFFGSTGCRKQHGERVILISVDALRPDFLSCYNPAIKTSPNIDRLAAEGLLCTDVVTQAPSTTLSHKSILYSLYPSVHKTSLADLPKELIPSPLDILKSKGFKTAAFVGGGQLSKRFGFSKGFDTYWEPGADVERNTKLKEMKPLALAWLEKNYSHKFFLFLHTYQVHCPYFPPDEYRKKYASWYKGDIDPEYMCQKDYNERKMSRDDYRFIRDLYAAEVNYTDSFIGDLIALLKKLRIYDETMIVFMSDHGESLGERDFVGHNQLFNTQLHIPLILRVPGIPHQRVDSPLEAIDVMPTIFDALGIGRPFPFQGQSILPLLDERVPQERYRIAEKEMSYAVQKGKWKGVFFRKNKDVFLYDLEKDPLENNNVSESNGAEIQRLARAYAKMQSDSADVSAKFVPRDTRNLDLDPQLKEELKALGYIQ
jgi:arylsulfatase A-like enzyme